MSRFGVEVSRPGLSTLPQHTNAAAGVIPSNEEAGAARPSIPSPSPASGRPAALSPPPSVVGNIKSELQLLVPGLKIFLDARTGSAALL